MHSDVYAYLQQVGALTFSTSSCHWRGNRLGRRCWLGSVEVARFMGLRVVQDDMLAPTVNDVGAVQYPVYLMGPDLSLKVCSRSCGLRLIATSCPCKM